MLLPPPARYDRRQRSRTTFDPAWISELTGRGRVRAALARQHLDAEALFEYLMLLEDLALTS